MKVHFGELAVEVTFSQDQSGNWHFAYEIPNYRGSGQAMRIASDMEFESEAIAQQHAEMAVKSDLERNKAEVEEHNR